MDLESIKSLSCDGQDMLKAEILSGDQFVTLWSETFDVSWELGGKGTMPAEYPVAYRYGIGIGQDAMPKPTRKGFKFAGWYGSAASAGDEISSITSTDKGNKTLYPKWKTSGCGTGYSWSVCYWTRAIHRMKKYLASLVALKYQFISGQPYAPHQATFKYQYLGYPVDDWCWVFYVSK